MRSHRAGHYARALTPLFSLKGCLCLCLALAGCWSPPPAAPPPPPPAAAPETPPVPAPEAPETPPVEEPAAPETPPETPPAVETPAPEEVNAPGTAALSRISADQIGALQAGMSLEAVAEAMGSPGQTVATDDVASAILRWTDAEGRSLVAKFENGLLVRKSLYDPDGGAGAPVPPGDDQNKITQTLYDAIMPGMTVTEIDALLALQGKRIAEGHEDVGIYRWVDGTGSNFTAKFESGKLTQKTGFYVAALRKEEEQAAEARAKAETPTPAETAAEEEPPGEGEGGEAESAGQPEGVRAGTFPAESPAETPQFVQQPQPSRQTAPRVRVAGKQRRTREAARRDPAEPAGSYRPKAKLPDYRWGLRHGAYEVRIHNPSDTTVKVGLRAGEGGKNVSIPPRSTESIRVDRANYELYYVFADNPYVLHKGGGIDLDSYWMADVEVTLFNEDYDLRTLEPPLE